MTPAKLLIAQRLDEAARELRSVVELMHEFKHDPAWADVARELSAIAELMKDHLTATVWYEVKNELSGTAETAQWFADRIRSEP